MTKVTGIGGVFFRADNPQALAAWYDEHLGISTSSLLWQQAGPTVWAPYERGSDYLGSAEQQWMVNFRVDDLDAMLERLKSKGIEVGGVIEHVTGRFARLADGEGNPIELWEPVADDQLKAIETTS